MRACHIMCHEIGHQFGLRHCIYYECLMNGIMSADEQRNGGIRLLCPVCHKKLKQNLKFDSGLRFERLAEVCDTLGFADEAAIYRKLLTDSASSASGSSLVNGRAPPASRRAASNISGNSATNR